MQHTFLPFIARLQRETSRNFQVTRFMEEMSYVLLLTFFFELPLFFTLVAGSISNFLTAATKFSCCFIQQKNFFFVFFIASLFSSLLPFFTLSFAGLSPTFSFLRLSLSLYSKFVDMAINLSLMQCALDNTDTETISAFRFHLYWLFSCLCFTRRVAMQIPTKTTFGLPYLLIELFFIGMPVVPTNERTVTWLPKFLGWLDYHIFLGMGLRSRARAPLLLASTTVVFQFYWHVRLIQC